MPNRVISILGCGWLGKSLGRSLSGSGYAVRGSTTRNENVTPLRESGIDPFVFKVGDSLPDDIARKFFSADVLVISLPHGARRGKSEEYLEQIRSVMLAANEFATRNIILISTTSVYGDLNRVVTEEDADDDNPIVKAEKLVRESGIPNTILRFSGLFGPGRHPGRFLAGKRDIKGGGSPVNMIHLDDCIGISLSVIQQNIWNEVLNACADDHPTRKTFYTKAAFELGVEPPVFADEIQSSFKIVSNERLKAVLSYTFIHSLT